MKGFLRSGWLAILLLAGAGSASAQYSLDWFTVDGGGGTSAAGNYSVVGTIGQPDAGPGMSGGSYTLRGGFFTFASLGLIPGIPLLDIELGPLNVTVSWPFPLNGFKLQASPTLEPTTWSDVPTSPTAAGDRQSVTLPWEAATLYFRLYQP